MKKITAILALTLMLATSAHAQIWIMEGDEGDNLRTSSDVNGEWNNVIIHGSPDDQTNYVPIGEGIALFASLGGVYLLRKKTKFKRWSSL